MSLNPGAVPLPMAHVSVRVPWNDTDWTGRVCRAPGQNHACTVLKNIKENKLYELEDEDAGRPWVELSRDRVPPCALERGGFMRPTPFEIERTHNYAWKRDGPHAHLLPTTQHMPKYSLEVTPYRWVMRDDSERYVDRWGIRVDPALEDRAEQLMNFSSHWIQDHRNQLPLLDSFFSALRPGKSLVLLYAKDLPLIEQPLPGERFLIGAGFVEDVRPVVEWNYSEPGPLRTVLWERGVTHSIRPDFENGFLLPYQELLADPALQGEDLERFVARTPAEHFDEFSFVSEHVTHDGAIAALTELGRVLDLLPGVVEGPWRQATEWVADRLADAWHARGPYPGLGPMLVAAGIERGPVLAQRVVEDLGELRTSGPWEALGRAIVNDTYGLAGRMARKAWTRLTDDPDRFRQLRVMSRFGLDADQARRLFSHLTPAEVIDNPYRLSEWDRDSLTPITFRTVDRGLWPQDAEAVEALATDPLPEPITEPGDDRRVRAASAAVLERAAEQGHTVLDEVGLRLRLAQLDVRPICDPPDAQFEDAVDQFEPQLVERPLARGGRGWQLDRLATATDLIRSEVVARLEQAPLDVEWDWRQRIDVALEDVDNASLSREEELARTEKAEALKTLVRSRISVLVGPAGTGKTTMLEALCDDADMRAGGVLLLAPTGKARVQLADRVKAPARTIAQFLRPHRWGELGYRTNPDAAREHGYRTVVIDEASMLTEEMLAAIIDAVAGVDRLVLCGDPRQLPPIGSGRPFADLVTHLQQAASPGGRAAELTIGRRQLPNAEDAPRDDVSIASLFSIDSELETADEALSRAIDGTSDETFSLVSWVDEDDLHRKIVEVLEQEELGLDSRSRGALIRSFGGACEDDGLPSFDWGSAGGGAERWQLLTPVRARPGGVAGLNRLVRSTWRPGDATLARRSRAFVSPMGADEIIFADKVMCLRNNARRAWDPIDRDSVDGSVANGEIGLVVGKAGRGRKGLRVEFSSQVRRQYTFWDNELNGEGDAGELLELAYAVTVHKSQGSQFQTTFVVVPDPCPLLSPELLYTALTRQQGRVVLFKQGDPSTLRTFASPARSETARRLTCLFRPADPLEVAEGVVVDGSHVHRTRNGELVRSKSEVIVADLLKSLGIEYGYEVDLEMPDGTRRSPDFTIHRGDAPTVYWEHLGMLDRPGYASAWKAKLSWYADHGILPLDEGGGPRGTLVWSTENQDGSGIDSGAIEGIARRVFALPSR